LGSFGAITLERLGVQRPKFCTWLDMVGAQLFTKFRIGAAWERGKSLWLPIKFPYGKFRSCFASS